MKQIIYCLLITLLCFPLHAQEQWDSRIGSTVPWDLQLKKILNHEKHTAQLSDYRGKIVILDFWATWCAPCIKAFPHLQALEETFAGKLKVFTITSTDTEERIAKFLQKFDTKLPIVMDEDGALKKQFPHRVISHTILIDQNGVVKAVTKPYKITEDVIRDLIKTNRVDLAEKKDSFHWKKEDHLNAESAIFQFTITPYEPGATGLVIKDPKGRFAIFNHDLAGMYKTLSGFTTLRTLYHTNNEYKTILELGKESIYWPRIENSYCMELLASDKTLEEMKELALGFLRQNFSLQSKIMKRKAKVKVLQRSGGPLKLKEGSPELEDNSLRSGAGILAYNKPVNIIAKYLEGFGIVRVPVLDETGLMEKYDIEIPFYAEDPEDFYDKLSELGLQVVDAKREIEFLVLYEKKKTHP